MTVIRCELTDSNEVKEIHKLVINVGVTPMDEDDYHDHHAKILEDFFNSPKGKFVREHGSNIIIRDWNSPESWSRRYEVVVNLESKKLSEYYLRFK